MRILVIEDETSLQRIIAKRLKESGFIIDCCGDGADGFDYAISAPYDCIILDLMIPKTDGITLLEKLRKNGCQSNVLILTARDSIEDRVKGLDAGADGYLVKPFSFDELLARIRVLIRRRSDTKDNILKIEDLTMDTIERRVTRDGKAIALTAKEYAMLEFMLRNQGRVLTRSQIADHVWSYDFDYGSNIVDVYIGYLRGKIDKNYDRKLIQTVRGAGYALRISDE